MQFRHLLGGLVREWVSALLLLSLLLPTAVPAQSLTLSEQTAPLSDIELGYQQVLVARLGISKVRFTQLRTDIYAIEQLQGFSKTLSYGLNLIAKMEDECPDPVQGQALRQALLQTLPSKYNRLAIDDWMEQLYRNQMDVYNDVPVGEDRLRAQLTKELRRQIMDRYLEFKTSVQPADFMPVQLQPATDDAWQRLQAIGLFRQQLAQINTSLDLLNDIMDLAHSTTLTPTIMPLPQRTTLSILLQRQPRSPATAATPALVNNKNQPNQGFLVLLAFATAFDLEINLPTLKINSDNRQQSLDYFKAAIRLILRPLISDARQRDLTVEREMIRLQSQILTLPPVITDLRLLSAEIQAWSESKLDDTPSWRMRLMQQRQQVHNQLQQLQQEAMQKQPLLSQPAMLNLVTNGVGNQLAHAPASIQAKAQLAYQEYENAMEELMQHLDQLDEGKSQDHIFWIVDNFAELFLQVVQAKPELAVYFSHYARKSFQQRLLAQHNLHRMQMFYHKARTVLLVAALISPLIGGSLLLAGSTLVFFSMEIVKTYAQWRIAFALNQQAAILQLYLAAAGMGDLAKIAALQQQAADYLVDAVKSTALLGAEALLYFTCLRFMPAKSAYAHLSDAAQSMPAMVQNVHIVLHVGGLLMAYYTVCFNMTVVHGTSMLPGIQDGDRVIVEPWSYLIGEVERGDVIVLRHPQDPKIDYIKRVIGLPGDKVTITMGHVYVNDKLLDEPYVTSADKFSALFVVVTPDHYFVLGDNRPESADSREFGLVDKKYVRGRVDLRFWPLSRVGLVP